MLTETISRRNEDGAGPDTVFGTSDDTKGSQNDISLLDGFLNPPEYTNGGSCRAADLGRGCRKRHHGYVRPGR
jgi:hypothetical protein